MIAPDMSTQMTFDLGFRDWARISPDRIPFECADTGRKFSYLALEALAIHIAKELINKYGIKRGDRIAVLAANELETYFLFLATLKIGAILVPINFRLAAPEIEYILQDASPNLLLVQGEFTHKTPASESMQIWLFDGYAGYKKFCSDFLDSGNFSISASDKLLGSTLEKPVMILYTSGTTGFPKGALITPGMILWNSISTGIRLGITSDDVTLTYLPLFHTSGWNVLVTPFIHHGAKVVFQKKFEAESTMEALDRYGVTVIFGVPTIMARLSETQAFSKASLANARFAIVGGEAMPIELIHKWQNRGIAIRQGFGMTEFGPNVFSLNEADSIRKIGSIGFPNFFIETRLVNDEGQDVATGEAGELLLRGPQTTPGYWRNQKASQDAFIDGWFRTGDILRKDEDGYFYVVDRKKDMFISGGENVYPLEIEHVLRSHPSIREAAVIGHADPKWGESGLAFIVGAQGKSTPSQEEIIQFCEARLAKYKVPKQFYFLPDLPKSDSGKILKRALRESLRA
jgi:fatty-acyl-CoA synthase